MKPGDSWADLRDPGHLNHPDVELGIILGNVGIFPHCQSQSWLDKHNTVGIWIPNSSEYQASETR